MKEKEMKRVPQLRFPEFTDDWEQRKLGEIYTERNERGNDNLEILSVSIHHGVSSGELDSDSLGKNVRRSEDKSLYKHVYKGDLVFNMMRAWQGAIGVVKNEGMISPAYISAIPNENVCPELMDYCLRRDEVIAQINNLSYGVTDFRKRLYWNGFTKVNIMLPSVQEQEKLTEIFRSLDHLITIHQRKLKKLKALKKSMMQKLFSQEVRFKADDGSEFPEWEEKKYLDVCDVFADGDWIESKDQSDSGIRLIQTGNIGNGTFIDKDDKKKYISKETFEILKCKEVFEGDILISRLPSPAGRACIVPKLKARMITAVDCTIVRTDKNIISRGYCVQFMQSSKHFYYVASMMAGGTRQRISRKNLEDELISVPCLAEQQKIADCLSSLDNVIEKEKATLTAWEELKKGLLQQMFV